MWFAIAIIGVIGIAFGVSALPGGIPHSSAPAATARAPTPATAPGAPPPAPQPHP